MRTSTKFSFALCVVALAGNLAFAQKAAPTPPKTTSNPEKAPDFSDADKKKMADIEQRPEIKDAIQAAWDDKRRQDIDYIYKSIRRLTSPTCRVRSMPPSAITTANSTTTDVATLYQRDRTAPGPQGFAEHLLFKLLLDPIPKAEALSTGTILISTGMVSMLDNEAQLAYVLGHEIAHVERNHAYAIVRMSVLEPALNAEKEKETQTKRAVLGAVTTFATGGMAASPADGRRSRRRHNWAGGRTLPAATSSSATTTRSPNGATFTRTRPMKPRCITCWTNPMTCARRRVYMPVCSRPPLAIRASASASWPRNLA